MNPYRAYQQQSAGWTRIELLLALYDGAIQRIEKALFLHQTQPSSTEIIPAISKAQLIVSELATGVKVEVNPEMNVNLLRLYEFVVFRLQEATPQSLNDSLKILKTLREGFQEIRVEANQMERNGELVQADNLHMLTATA
jgi:flagellar secretion chaperone FliS